MMGWKNLVRMAGALAFCLVCVLCGCESRVTSPTDGSFKNNVYTNRFFRIGTHIPQAWTILPRPSAAELQRGTTTALGGNKSAAAALLQSPGTVHHLLRARHLDQGKSIAILAEKISPTENQNGRDFLDLAAHVLTGEGKPLEQVNAIAPVKLAGREFHRLDLAGKFSGQIQYQSMLATLEKGHALMIVAAAKSEAGVDQVLAEVGLAVTKIRTPEPLWVREIRLQGISGTAERRLALINGKTFASGDSDTVKTVLRTATIRCVSVGPASARIKIDGVEGEQELQLLKVDRR
jgi:hypothetical protein